MLRRPKHSKNEGVTPKEEEKEELLYCPYMFRHYCVIFRELVVSTLLSYISVSVQLLVIQFKIYFPNLSVQNHVHTRAAQRQHQHTDCMYGHHTGLHKNCNNTIILAILL
jgi:hypothetical protein